MQRREINHQQQYNEATCRFVITRTILKCFSNNPSRLANEQFRGFDNKILFKKGGMVGLGTHLFVKVGNLTKRQRKNFFESSCLLLLPV